MSDRACGTGWLSVVVVFACVCTPAFAEKEAKTPDRWEEQIAAFERADKETPPPQQGVLFIGSSSIRLWNLAQSFPDQPVINRGFGGSHAADSAHFADRIAIPYKPRLIVFYAGDNDIADGVSPAEVAAAFERFCKAVHAALPETRIAFIAIKPSRLRWRFFSRQQDANQRVQEFVDRDPRRLVYVDVVTPMLDEFGEPRSDLFEWDRLHLNKKGYELWTDLLRPLVVPPAPTTTANQNATSAPTPR